MVKNLKFILVFIGVFALIFLIIKIFPPPGSKEPGFRFIRMTITSSAFANNENIPVKYTCDGDKVSPPLEITDVPKAAKSLRLVIEDPDAPSGTFTHLKMEGIDPATTAFSEGQLADYIPPCPPSGTHHYNFILTALNDKGAVVSKTTLTGLYSKK